MMTTKAATKESPEPSPSSVPPPHTAAPTTNHHLARQSMPFLFPKRNRPLSTSAAPSSSRKVSLDRSPSPASSSRTFVKPWPKLPQEGASSSTSSSPANTIFRRTRQQSESGGSRRSFFGPGGRLRTRSPSNHQAPPDSIDHITHTLSRSISPSLPVTLDPAISLGEPTSSSFTPQTPESPPDRRTSLSADGGLPIRRVNRKAPPPIAPPMSRSRTEERAAVLGAGASSNLVDENLYRRASMPRSDGTSHKLFTVGSPLSGMTSDYPSSAHGSSSSGGLFSSDSASIASSRSNFALGSSAGNGNAKELDAHTLALELHGLVKQLESRSSPAQSSPGMRTSPQKSESFENLLEEEPLRATPGELLDRHSGTMAEQLGFRHTPSREIGRRHLTRDTTPKNHNGIPPEPAFGGLSYEPSPMPAAYDEMEDWSAGPSAPTPPPVVKPGTPELSLAERSRLLRQLWCLGPDGPAGNDTSPRASVDWGSLGVPTELASRVSISTAADGRPSATQARQAFYSQPMHDSEEYRRRLSEPLVESSKLPLAEADSVLSGEFYTPIPSPPVKAADASPSLSSSLSSLPLHELPSRASEHSMYARLASVRVGGNDRNYEASEATTSSRNYDSGPNTGVSRADDERMARSGLTSRMDDGHSGSSMRLSMLSESDAQSYYGKTEGDLPGTAARVATASNLRLASQALDAYQSALRVLFGMVHEDALTPRELDSLLTAASGKAFEESRDAFERADAGRGNASVEQLSRSVSKLDGSPLDVKAHAHAAWVANASLVGAKMDDEALDRIDGWRAQVEPSGRSRSNTTPTTPSQPAPPTLSASASQQLSPRTKMQALPSGLVGASHAAIPPFASPSFSPLCHTPRARSIEGSPPQPPSLQSSPSRPLRASPTRAVRKGDPGLVYATYDADVSRALTFDAP